MSHEIKYATYEENVNKQKVQAYWDDYAAKEDWQEGCSGLDSNIEWKDKIFDTYDEAYEYLYSISQKHRYTELAVKYRSYPELKHSKTYEILQERKQRLTDKYHEYESKIHYEGVKSAFITCRTCESKISTAYIGKKKPVGNRCPICSGDLRPQSTIEQIAIAKKNAQKATKEFSAEEKKLQQKQKKKSTINWLVHIEYHT